MRRHSVIVIAGAFTAASSMAYAQSYNDEENYSAGSNNSSAGYSQSYDDYQNRNMHGRNMQDHSMSGDRWSRGSERSSYRDSDRTYSQNQQGSQQTLPRQIRNKLQSQGYSNVRIAPGSYVVTAQDKDGDNVVMMIGPHSVTMIQAMSTGGSPDSETTGSTPGGSMSAENDAYRSSRDYSSSSNPNDRDDSRGSNNVYRPYNSRD